MFLFLMLIGLPRGDGSAGDLGKAYQNIPEMQGTAMGTQRETLSFGEYKTMIQSANAMVQVDDYEMLIFTKFGKVIQKSPEDFVEHVLSLPDISYIEPENSDRITFDSFSLPGSVGDDLSVFALKGLFNRDSEPLTADTLVLFERGVNNVYVLTKAELRWHIEKAVRLSGNSIKNIRPFAVYGDHNDIHLLFDDRKNSTLDLDITTMVMTRVSMPGDWKSYSLNLNDPTQPAFKDQDASLVQVNEKEGKVRFVDFDTKRVQGVYPLPRGIPQGSLLGAFSHDRPYMFTLVIQDNYEKLLYKYDDRFKDYFRADTNMNDTKLSIQVVARINFKEIVNGFVVIDHTLQDPLQYIQQ
jgi:hypothetical protein